MKGRVEREKVWEIGGERRWRGEARTRKRVKEKINVSLR